MLDRELKANSPDDSDTSRARAAIPGFSTRSGLATSIVRVLV